MTLASGQAIPPDVARSAVEWMVELQADPVPESVRAAWTQWRAQHPLHEHAWQRIETVNGRLGSLSSAPLHTAIAHATLAPPGSGSRRRAVQALAVVLFAGGVGWTVQERTPWRQWAADHHTGVGDTLALTLDDGSRLVLGTGSAVNVRFTAAERRLQLVSGEVWVSTAKDTAHGLHRLFLVETPQGDAQALGTRFTVRGQGASTQVSVFEGAVALRPRHATATHYLTLQAGEQAAFTTSAITQPMAADEASAAWVDGFIVARGMRLADFLAELGRYSPHPLSCDPAVAGLRVSGSYPVADVDKVLDTLSATLSLQVETVTRFWGQQVVRISLAPRGQQG